MLAAAWLMLSSLLYSLQLSSGSFPRPLTEEEERYYLELAGKGDLEARNVLVERNLRLVAHIMKKYYAQTSDQEDLISIGTIGLIKGITTFDPSKGARLATYAARCVENAILTPRRFQIIDRQPKGSEGQSKEKAGDGRFYACSLLLSLTVSMTVSKRSSFCLVGQFSNFSR